MNKTYQLTEDGIKELNEELANLVSKRPEIADQIRTARESGDLSENAEYQLAREEQQKSEARIAEIEDVLANAKVINKSGNKTAVELGSHVTLKNDGKTKEFQVVGTVEADPIEGKISDESPMGQALLGKTVGDSVAIATSASTTSYKIDSIF